MTSIIDTNGSSSSSSSSASSLTGTMLHPTLEQVRQSSEKALKELLKTALSRLMDIESGFDFDHLSTLSSSHRTLQCETVFGAPLTTEGICTINQLLQHIRMKKNITQEGLFRKSGSKARQTELQRQLSTGHTIHIGSNFGVHDVCCLVKKFIADLPSPLMTDSLGSLFIKTADIKLHTKRLDAMRIIIHLMPVVNRIFLHDLMILFTEVIAEQDANRMSASNLATIFAATMFFGNNGDGGGHGGGGEQLRQCFIDGKMVQALQFAIEHGAQLFEPPADVLQAAQGYLHNLDQCTTSLGRHNNHHQMLSTTALIPATKLCITTTYDSKDYTQRQLEELRAQIAAHSAGKLQTSTKKKKTLLNRLDKEVAGTPLTKLKRDKVQQQLIKQSLKKSAKKVSNHQTSSSTTTTASSSNGGNHHQNFVNKTFGTVLKKFQIHKSSSSTRSISPTATKMMTTNTSLLSSSSSSSRTSISNSSLSINSVGSFISMNHNNNNNRSVTATTPMVITSKTNLIRQAVGKVGSPVNCLSPLVCSGGGKRRKSSSPLITTTANNSITTPSPRRRSMKFNELPLVVTIPSSQLSPPKQTLVFEPQQHPQQTQSHSPINTDTQQQSSPPPQLQLRRTISSINREKPPIPPKPKSLSATAVIGRQLNDIQKENLGVDDDNDDDDISSYRSMSTKSLPVTTSVTKPPIKNNRIRSSPLLELNQAKRVKILTAKYESMASSTKNTLPLSKAANRNNKNSNNNKLSHHQRNDQAPPKTPIIDYNDDKEEEENDNDEYVCLEKISTRFTDSNSSSVSIPASSSRQQQRFDRDDSQTMMIMKAMLMANKHPRTRIRAKTRQRYAIGDGGNGSTSSSIPPHNHNHRCRHQTPNHSSLQHNNLLPQTPL